MVFEDFEFSEPVADESPVRSTEGFDRAVLEARYRWSLLNGSINVIRHDERRSQLTEDEAAKVKAEVAKMNEQRLK